MMDLKNGDIKEVKEMWTGKFLRIRSAFDHTNERWLDNIRKFFVLDPKRPTQGECQSWPGDADCILEGVLDEDSSSD